METHLVAVYGTLKRGFYNHAYLLSSKFLKASHTGEGYALFFEQLPFLEKHDKGKGCQIEIFEVTSEVLVELDYLEGHPDFYKREVLRKDGDLPVWIYIYNSDSKHFKKRLIKNAIDSYEE